ncbi:unnamed protein product [Caenorhabditis brenneri]
MQTLILLVLSVGVFVGNGMSQPAPAADFVVEAGELLNDRVGDPLEAGEVAQKTITAFLEAIQSKNIDALFKLVAHTEEDKKHAKEIFDAWQRVQMTVKSSKQSGDVNIIAVVLFIIGKEKKIGDVILAKNTDSPTGWIIAQLPDKTTPAKHRRMLPINRMINHTIVAN